MRDQFDRLSLREDVISFTLSSRERRRESNSPDASDIEVSQFPVYCPAKRHNHVREEAARATNETRIRRWKHRRHQVAIHICEISATCHIR